jgi:PilZ domain-containing protein
LPNRLHPRYPVEYTAAFLGERITTSGLILNLSSGGCRVRSIDKLRQGDVLQLLIDVPRYQTLVEVNQARVQWSTGDECGLKFSGIPAEEDHRLLNELILAAQAANRQDT